ncbi:hypothetical protein GCM10027347_30230 [Larkinella harenae]
MTKTVCSLFFIFLIGLATSPSLLAQNRLKKVTYSDGSVRQFFYDATGKLTREELTRNQEALSQIQHSFGSTGKLATYSMQYTHPEAPWNYGYAEQYKYSPEGRLNAKERYVLRKNALSNQPDRTLFFTDSLIYSTTGKVVGRQRYTYAVRGEAAGSSPITMATHQYRYDDKNNLVEETITTVPLQRSAAASTQTRRIVYDYDTRPNPYGLNDCPVFDQVSWSKNNCVRASTYQVNAGTQTKPEVSEFRYVYNNNLPIRRVQAANSTVLEQYEYEAVSK